MIDSAGAGGEPVEPAQRSAWRDQVARTRVSGRCGCGECPTVDLVAEDGTEPQGPRTTLLASSGEGGLILFIDGGRLSCLELFPTRDDRVEEFPHPGELEY